MTTDNSRADALTDDKIIDEISRAAGYDWPIGCRPQRDENTGYFFTYGELADLIHGLLAASPVEQPAGAPIDERTPRFIPTRQYGRELWQGGAKLAIASSDAIASEIATALNARAPSLADERAVFIDSDLNFEPDAQHAVADMANIGYALMQTIYEMVPGYSWLECPTEIVSDLINERDEARAASANETRA